MKVLERYYLSLALLTTLYGLTVADGDVCSCTPGAEQSTELGSGGNQVYTIVIPTAGGGESACVTAGIAPSTAEKIQNRITLLENKILKETLLNKEQDATLANLEKELNTTKLEKSLESKANNVHDKREGKYSGPIQTEFKAYLEDDRASFLSGSAPAYVMDVPKPSHHHRKDTTLNHKDTTLNHKDTTLTKDAAMMEQLEAQDKRLSEIQETNKDQEEKFVEIYRRNNNLSVEMARSKLASLKVTATIEKLQQSNKNLTQQLSSVQEENRQHKVKLQETWEVLSDYKSSFNQLVGQFQQLAKVNTQLESTVKNLSQTLQHLQQTHNHQQTKMASMEQIMNNCVNKTCHQGAPVHGNQPSVRPYETTGAGYPYHMLEKGIQLKQAPQMLSAEKAWQIHNQQGYNTAGHNKPGYAAAQRQDQNYYSSGSTGGNAYGGTAYGGTAYGNRGTGNNYGTGNAYGSSGGTGASYGSSGGTGASYGSSGGTGTSYGSTGIGNSYGSSYGSTGNTYGSNTAGSSYVGGGTAYGGTYSNGGGSNTYQSGGSVYRSSGNVGSGSVYRSSSAGNSYRSGRSGNTAAFTQSEASWLYQSDGSTQNQLSSYPLNSDPTYDPEQPAKLPTYDPDQHGYQADAPAHKPAELVAPEPAKLTAYANPQGPNTNHATPLKDYERDYITQYKETQYADTPQDNGAYGSSYEPMSELLKVSNLPRDCADWFVTGHLQTDIYMVEPTDWQSFPVSCDMTTAGGGWTVLQRRSDGSVDFNRDWAAYARGFGSISSEHWLGLDNLFYLTRQRNYRLRIDLTDWTGRHVYAEYDRFYVDDADNKYRLHISGYRGNANDSMVYHDRQKFSTRDQDNDHSGGHCAEQCSSGWWFNNCHFSNLNGVYHQGGPYNHTFRTGIEWYHWKGKSYSLKGVEMKVRPSDF